MSEKHYCCLHAYDRGLVARILPRGISLLFCCREPCRRLLITNRDREEKTHGGSVFDHTQIDLDIGPRCDRGHSDDCEIVVAHGERWTHCHRHEERSAFPDPTAIMRCWAESVKMTWEEHWKGREDHRYGRDFTAFLGERLLTDYELHELR